MFADVVFFDVFERSGLFLGAFVFAAALSSFVVLIIASFFVIKGVLFLLVRLLLRFLVLAWAPVTIFTRVHAVLLAHLVLLLLLDLCFGLEASLARILLPACLSIIHHVLDQKADSLRGFHTGISSVHQILQPLEDFFLLLRGGNFGSLGLLLFECGNPLLQLRADLVHKV